MSEMDIIAISNETDSKGIVWRKDIPAGQQGTWEKRFAMIVVAITGFI